VARRMLYTVARMPDIEEELRRNRPKNTQVFQDARK